MNTTGFNGTDQFRTFPPMKRPLAAELRIFFYSVIFLLSVVGNALVIVTLIQNRRMRTVTNVFLLNLSVSDLLLAVLCMPFTLVPTLLQDFIFGATMCVLIRYVQGMCSVPFCFSVLSSSVITINSRNHVYFTKLPLAKNYCGNSAHFHKVLISELSAPPLCHRKWESCWEIFAIKFSQKLRNE